VIFLKEIPLFILKAFCEDFDIKEKDKNMCMDSLLHAADISNPMKSWDVYFQWTERVLTEFWLQVSYFSKIQSNFIAIN